MRTGSVLQQAYRPGEEGSIPPLQPVGAAAERSTGRC